MAGLILAGFIGGAIRTLLSSDQIQSRILNELRSQLPNLEVSMEPAHVSLAQGIWPGITISIPMLHVTKPESCGDIFGRVDIESIVLPLDLLSLLRKNLHLDVISVGKLDLAFGRSSCPLGEASHAWATKPSFTEPTAPPNRQLISQIFSDVTDLRERLKGLQIRRAMVTSIDDSSWHLIVSDLSLRYKDRLVANGNIEFEKNLAGGKIEHALNLHAEADRDELWWTVKVPWKEGVIIWVGDANHVHNKISQKIDIKQLPLKDVLIELQTLLNGPKGGSPKFIWMSCHLTQDGPFNEFDKLPLVIGDCKVDGEGERITVNAGQEIFYWESVPLHHPLSFEVDHVSLQTLLDLFGSQGLPSVLPKPGLWTGEVKFENPKLWEMKGTLEGAEVVFSHRSVRGKQIVRKLTTHIRAETTKVIAELTDVQLSEGTAKGKIDFQLDPTFKNGTYKVDLNSFSLSPSIQSMMTGGRVAPMEITGKGEFENGKIVHWKGQARIPNFTGEGWQLANAQVDSEYTNGQMALRIRLATADFEPEFSHSDLLEKIFGSQGTNWKFREGLGVASLSNTGGSVKDLRLKGANGRLVRLSGEWANGGDLVGSAEVGGKRWKLKTVQGHVQVVDTQ